ncbi:MAG: hypothetical protein JNJ78_13660 [Anaerolineae bacterium]|nr:hypothetical protein [Anaerolineae bacterium]
MADLYFACGWVIRPNTDFHALMHAAADAGCELVAVAPINISQQGYAVLTFALRTTSEAQLVAFIQHVGPDLGLTHWYGVTQDYFSRGAPLYLQMVSDEMRNAWLEALDAYGHHNDSLRAKLESGAS